MIGHVASIGFVQITATGTVKPRTSMTIGEVATSSTEIRIFPDDTLPNTVGYPTIKDYLETEAAAGFKLVHLDQTYCITYDS